MPVSRLREVVPAACIVVLRFGGRRQVGKIMLKQQARVKSQTTKESFHFSSEIGEKMLERRIWLTG